MFGSVRAWSQPAGQGESRSRALNNPNRINRTEPHRTAMKSNLMIRISVLGMAALIGGTGCKHTSPHPTPIPGARDNIKDPSASKNGGVPFGGVSPAPPAPVTSVTPPEPSTTSSGIAAAEDKDWSTFNVDRSTLQPNTVYFDYDSAVIKKSEMKNLDAVAKYLKDSPNDKVGIEGNCDERGTPEYNRALGERRAQAAREYLIKTGKISGNRILTKSYGDQRPAVPGHDDASRSKNRRDEFVVLKPK